MTLRSMLVPDLGLRLRKVALFGGTAVPAHYPVHAHYPRAVPVKFLFGCKIGTMSVTKPRGFRQDSILSDKTGLVFK